MGVKITGSTPKPRNDSADSVRIAAATASVVLMMIWPVQFGTRCRNMIRKSDAPAARAGFDELLLLQRQHRARG